MTQMPKTFRELTLDDVQGKVDFVVNVAEIKKQAYEFAVQTTRNGIYNPDQVMEEAKKIFDWFMDNEAFEKQT